MVLLYVKNMAEKTTNPMNEPEEMTDQEYERMDYLYRAYRERKLTQEEREELDKLIEKFIAPLEMLMGDSIY